jgi:methyl-accepting chemotaxis protein
LAAREEVFAAKKSGNEDQAKQLTDARLEPALATYLDGIKGLSDLQLTEIANDTGEVANQFSNSKIGLNLLTVLALMVSMLFAWAISRSITRPLQEAIDISKAVSMGDLSTAAFNVNGQDELSELLWGLKNMNENLGVLVGQVRASADSIAVTSGHITSGSLNLSIRTEQQASSLEETASAMEELTSTVKQNADNAYQANNLAESASAVAIKGGVVVSQVVHTMESINESSKKIADIIGVIDGIAFQTNILALNAAVEAARAGEQGRGFAVVATEVRNLAQRSAAAAREIKTLIDDSVEKVALGGKLVSQAGSTMDEIVTSIKSVTDIVGEITIASREQSAGIDQISSSINHLDKTTQQNAILVENSLESTQNLEEKARSLVEVVQVFKLDHTQVAASGAAATAQNRLAEPRGTAKEAIALVKRAIEFRNNFSKRDAFLHGITERANKFFDRDMYVFALDKNGKYLAFGGNPGKVGTHVQDISGIDGDGLVRAIVEQCNEGPGWVDYDIFNAVTNKVQSKRSYVEPIDGVFLGCGIYTSLT